MFMREFDTEQKKAITKLAYSMMMADEKMRAEEQDIVTALGHELGVSHLMQPTDFHVPADLSLFATPQAKLALMLKLFAIAYSDRQMHPEEAEVLREYSRRLGIGAGEFDDLNEWGKRHFVLVEQAKAMLKAFERN
jgi:uncharacterized tellurite resistance protein B-like protein